MAWCTRPHSETTRGEKKHIYVGLAKIFKKRFGKHKATLTVYKPDGNTALSTHFWQEKEAGRDPKVKWKILEKSIPTCIPETKICRLCIREKFNIVMNPHLATLNSRQERAKVNWQTPRLKVKVSSFLNLIC
jgi:hypothetical protein